VGKALAAVGDGHSFFATPAQVNWHKQQAQTNASQPSGCIVEGRIGYIQIPAFSAPQCMRPLVGTSHQQLMLG
jgi:hypothetical protein